MDTYQVLQNFRDSKDEFKLYKEGEEAKFTKERGEFLVEKGYLAVVKDSDKAKAKAKNAAPEKAKEPSAPKEPNKAKVVGLPEKVDEGAKTKEEKEFKPTEPTE